jgi:hypothetical protein
MTAGPWTSLNAVRGSEIGAALAATEFRAQHRHHHLEANVGSREVFDGAPQIDAPKYRANDET